MTDHIDTIAKLKRQLLDTRQALYDVTEQRDQALKDLKRIKRYADAMSSVPGSLACTLAAEQYRVWRGGRDKLLFEDTYGVNL